MGVWPGLCETCRWVRVIQTQKGTVYHWCGHSRVDPRFPRYPRLPVMNCTAFREGED